MIIAIESIRLFRLWRAREESERFSRSTRDQNVAKTELSHRARTRGLLATAIYCADSRAGKLMLLDGLTG